VVGAEVPHAVGARRAGDPPVLVASNERIVKELGWRPQFGDLRAMVSHALAWRSRHPDGYGKS